LATIFSALRVPGMECHGKSIYCFNNLIWSIRRMLAKQNCLLPRAGPMAEKCIIPNAILRRPAPRRIRGRGSQARINLNQTVDRANKFAPAPKLPNADQRINPATWRAVVLAAGSGLPGLQCGTSCYKVSPGLSFHPARLRTAHNARLRADGLDNTAPFPAGGHRRSETPKTP
jgi:hypothetical protein